MYVYPPKRYNFLILQKFYVSYGTFYYTFIFGAIKKEGFKPSFYYEQTDGAGLSSLLRNQKIKAG